jgi:hypothetical protein
MPFKVFITEKDGVFTARHNDIVKQMEDQGEGELYCEFELGQRVLACFRTNRGTWESEEGWKKRVETVWVPTRTHYVFV